MTCSPLQGNPSSLQDDMRQLFDRGLETNFPGMSHDVYETKEKGHGRIDERSCHVIAIPQDHPQRERWKDLKTLAVTVSRRVIDEKETWASRLYVSSHAPRANCDSAALEYPEQPALAARRDVR
ncbi:MAG: hypothetical protein IH899_06220 [Planctomycetes bacterium]|nr:hypothetical protein [Planctomycetota bacterium]